MKEKRTILIADDTEVNRSLLSDILSEEYNIIEVGDGIQAVQYLEHNKQEVALLLLDIVMPNMDGFEVLAYMYQRDWIDDIPVMIISAETSPAYIRKGFSLGASDYISRPFDPEVVLQRARNTLMLYAKQARLKKLVDEQVQEKEKNNTLMVDILSTVVEFRNGESGLHVIRIRMITKILLEALSRRKPEYNLTPAKIVLISNAAALHDIGKLIVPEEILDKPNKLTREEFEVMKKHPVIGDEMLDSLHFGKDEELVRYAKQICRWHHERWDGKGYPDGLEGDDIPIAAQTVALADVYDALVSERVYKPAYEHDKAVEMITSGECGSFNPILLECFLKQTEKLRQILHENTDESEVLVNVSQQSKEMLARSKAVVSDRTLTLLERERSKYQFLASISNEVLFEYDVDTDTVTFSERGTEELGLPPIIVSYSTSDAQQELFTELKDAMMVRQSIASSTPQDPITRLKMPLKKPLKNGESVVHWYEIILRTLWIEEQEKQRICGIIGRISNIHEQFMRTSMLQKLAYQDALTGLYNTAMSRQRVTEILAECSQQNKLCAMLLFDLDHFKQANDTYGHLFGDRVLCYVAKLMESNIRKSDIAARVGGDEFLIFLQNLDSLDAIDAQCNRIFTNLSGNCGGFNYTVSMGVAIYPTHGVTYEALFHSADQALYYSKNAGRGRYTYYGANQEGYTSLISPIDSEEDRQ